MLTIGIFFNLLVNLNEVAIVFVSFEYIMPILSLTYLFESVRLSRFFKTESDLRIRELEGEIIRVSKVASIGFIAANITHDIRNPLAVIHSSAQIVRKHMKNLSFENEKCLNFLTKIEKSTSVATQICSSYLKMLNNSSDTKLSRLNSRSIMQESLDLAHRKLDQFGITNVKISGLNEDFDGNEGSLLLVLVNLISNSCDAIKSLDERWIEIHCSKKLSNLKFSVTDSGSGIPQHLKEKIFQKQFTTKGRDEGHGLGLDIVKSLVEQSSGRVYIDESCENTRFVVDIPYKNHASIA